MGNAKQNFIDQLSTFLSDFSDFNFSNLEGNRNITSIENSRLLSYSYKENINKLLYQVKLESDEKDFQKVLLQAEKSLISARKIFEKDKAFFLKVCDLDKVEEINNYSMAYFTVFLHYRAAIESFLSDIQENDSSDVKKTIPNELLSNQITHPKKVEIAKAIKQKYSSYRGKDFKILFEALLKLDLFPKKGKRNTFFRCLRNEGYNINNHQILEDINFRTGFTNKINGKYEKSDHEKQRDTIIEYLKTIIEGN